MFPELVNRSATPCKTFFNEKIPGSTKSFALLKPARKVSVSPIRQSPLRKDSDESTFNARTVSDEIQSMKSEQDLGLRRINTLIAELDSKTQKQLSKNKKQSKKTFMNKYNQIADALLTMTNSTSGQTNPFNLVKVFIGLGYTTDSETLVTIIKKIFQSSICPNKTITKQDILKICNDCKVDCILRTLLKQVKENYIKEKVEGFDSLILVIKK